MGSCSGRSIVSRKESTTGSCENDHIQSAVIDNLRVKILMDCPLEFMCPTIVLVYGAPGAVGKEIANYMCQKFKFNRLEQDEFGIAQEGDNIVTWDGFLFRLKGLECKRGFVMENFPRTLEEAQTFSDMTLGYKKVVIFIEQDWNVRYLTEARYTYCICRRCYTPITISSFTNPAVECITSGTTLP
jgi:hypothetical protein